MEDDLINWVYSILNLETLDYEIVVNTPWSKVLKIKVKAKTFYLKQTPIDLFIEPQVINVIQKNMINSATPKVIFKNAELNCFLMESCGDHSLRTKFNGTLDAGLLIKGLKSYTRIQRSLENTLQPFEEIAIPNWRINHFPNLYVNLIENKEVMQMEGFKPNEIDNLKNLVPKVQSICKALSDQKVKDTLVNCDFNENNLIVNEGTQEISVIDLGESVISHPFFSIAAHLHNIARRYKLELGGEPLESIRYKWLSCWLDITDIEALEQIYQNILMLYPIFCALSTYRLQTATNNKSKEMQTWFIRDILGILLKNENL